MGSAFVELAQRRLLALERATNQPIKVGYVGNLLMPYIDREGMLELMERHPSVEFHLWGPRTPSESNVGADDGGSSFTGRLARNANVILHGPKTPAQIAEQIGDSDILLMCYSVARDPNRGCNSHKILEYLSTGNVIVANHVSDYAEQPGLIEMVPADGCRTLLEVFDAVLRDLEVHNAPSRRERRLRYTLDNSYPAQIDRIAAFRNTVAGAMTSAENARSSVEV